MKIKKAKHENYTVLMSQTKSKRMGCINRDNNSVKNMKKLVNCFLRGEERPKKFTREYILTKGFDHSPNVTQAGSVFITRQKTKTKVKSEEK